MPEQDPIVEDPLRETVGTVGESGGCSTKDATDAAMLPGAAKIVPFFIVIESYAVIV
jgi:hypothetical protein